MSFKTGTISERGEFVPSPRYLYRREGTLLVMARPEKAIRLFGRADKRARRGVRCKVFEFCPLDYQSARAVLR
jgi:hypothetical protein